MEYIVDAQGFRTPVNEFAVKELSILSLDENIELLFKFLFQPSCEWDSVPSHYKRINRWLKNNFHCLEWSSGDVPYAHLPIILVNILKNAKTIYVKEKRRRNGLKISLIHQQILLICRI